MMANQLSTNPWIIDTPSNNVLFDGRIPHIQVELVAYGTTAVVAEVQDRYGRMVALLDGLATGQTVRTGRIGWVQGFKVPLLTTAGGTNLSSGKLIVYYE